MGFVDKEKLDELAEKIADKFREIGLTVQQMGAMIDESGDVIIHSVVMVRETAYKQITEDLETREQLNRMAAADHNLALQQRADAIAAAVEGGYVMDILKGKRELIECSHERIYEGLCLDCGQVPEGSDDEETT